MFYIFLIILFLSTYFFQFISLLYTESFILGIAFFTIFFWVLSQTSLKINYHKEDFKWNETMMFYIIIKNWNRALIRDINIKIFNYLILAIEIQKYEIMWVKRNINKLER